MTSPGGEPAEPDPGRRIRLRLAYDGTRYSGWQAQPGRATVQGTLAAAIRSVSGEDVVPRGASRTDAGVHALDQVAAFTTAGVLDPPTWRRALNANLPEDITVTEAVAVDAAFDPVSAAVRKRYRYRIHDAPWRPVLDRRLVWRWRGRLDDARMAEAAGALVGCHDFSSFETAASPRRSKVRTVFSLDVTRPRLADDEDGAEVWIEIEGDGFLYNMVRIIAGSLALVGAGRRSAPRRESRAQPAGIPAAGPTAPPQGLVLAAIHLSPESR